MLHNIASRTEQLKNQPVCVINKRYVQVLVNAEKLGRNIDFFNSHQRLDLKSLK